MEYNKVPSTQQRCKWGGIVETSPSDTPEACRALLLPINADDVEKV